MENALDRLPKDIKENYKIKSEFIKQNQTIEIEHITCGKVYNTTFSKLFRGMGKCPLCVYNRHNTESFNTLLENTVDGEYTLVEEYKGYCTKTEFLHIRCGTVYSVRPADFLNNNRCPKCQKDLNCSYLEIEIDRFLCSYGIDYVREYRIKDCRNINPLPFDFAIFNNNKLVLLIETDGEQHFKPTSVFGGDEAFIKRLENDKIKNNFCKNKNIKLLRISNLKNCINILDQELENLKTNYVKCENTYSKKLNAEIVGEIRKSYSQGIRGKDIINLHSINQQQLGNIINYRIFSDVRLELKPLIDLVKIRPNYNTKPKKLSLEQEKEIISLFENKYKKTDIAKQFKISTNLVLKTIRFYSQE